MAAERRATRLTVSVERLREVIAEQRQREVSIRQIAADAGLGTTTVWQFVHGSTPQPGTHAKLAAWYLRLRAGAADEAVSTDPALAAAAIDVLTRGLQPQARDAFVRELIRVHESTPGAALPPWLDALRARGR